MRTSEKRLSAVGCRLPAAARRALALLGVVGLSGCTDWALYDLDRFWGTIPWLSTLRTSVAYDWYEAPRLPPPGAIPLASPIGEVLPPFTPLQLDSVAATLTNPLQLTPAVLARGQVVYAQHCVACHNTQGQGNGPVTGPGKYPFAPAINGAQGTVARPEPYVYAITRVGRGLMPAYGERITHLDRWAVAMYVRDLQRRAGAAPAAMTTTTAASAPAAAAPAGAAPPPTAPPSATPDTAPAAPPAGAP